MGDEDPVTKAIAYYKKGIDKYERHANNAKLLHCVERLDGLPVTLVHLQTTGIGRVINGLKKYGGKVGETSRRLVNKWRKMLYQEVPKKEEQHEAQSPESPDAEDEVDNDDNSKAEEDEEETEVEEKENNYSSHLEESGRKSDATEEDEEAEDEDDEPEDEPEGGDEEEEDEDDDESQQSDCDRKEASSEGEDCSRGTGSGGKKRKKDHHHRHHHHSNSSSSSSHGRSRSDDKLRDKDSKRKKSSHRESKKKHHHHHHHRRRSEKEELQDGERSSSSKHRLDKDKDKDKENRKEKSSSSASCSSSRKESKKEHRKEERKSRESHHRSSSSSTSASKRRKETDDGEASRKSKKKKKKNGDVSEEEFGSGCGTSFAEVLGMMDGGSASKGGVMRKKTASPAKVEAPKPEFKLPEFKLPEDKNIDLLAPNMNAILKPLDPRIQDLEITTNYRPLAHYPTQEIERIQPKNKPMTEEEALSKVITTKHLRTKVFSGVKGSHGVVRSLYDICLAVLKENIGALDHTGGVPYFILKPVLAQATPDQLEKLEYYNAYLLEDTGELWEHHCHRYYPAEKRREMESWKEMYARCKSEKDARFRALAANIKHGMDRSINPVRQTMRAYMDSPVKPPRSIARKQAKMGSDHSQKAMITPSARLASIAAAAGGVPVPNPITKNPRASAAAALVKPKKAPLMQKTLQFMRSRNRR